ncbi:hypothetical protein D3C72_2300740 [compost metagenome]
MAVIPEGVVFDLPAPFAGQLEGHRWHGEAAAIAQVGPQHQVRANAPAVVAEVEDGGRQHRVLLDLAAPADAVEQVVVVIGVLHPFVEQLH